MVNRNMEIDGFYQVEGVEVQRTNRCFDCPHLTTVEKTPEAQASCRMKTPPHRCHNAASTLCAGPGRAGQTLHSLACEIQGEICEAMA